VNGTDSFEQSFVAVTYLLGRRTELLSGLSSPGDAARRAAEKLSVGEQSARARSLAALLVPLARALEERELA